ncbi:hypothetical protein AABC73_15065 [Pseudomonas sp. G.S.17]|uniref:hypothetical protein n=1 Tax=Pseudomonas sp. G.S.17 TaxID=3137451 RepID=UPI00311CDEAE
MELKESKHPKPKSDEDALTIELRNEFALLNKIFELREIARDTSKKKLNRKAAKAAIKETKKTSNNNASLKAPKLPKPSSPPRKPEGEWIKKICWRCNSKFAVHSHWLNKPSMCRACAKDLDETYLPSGPDHSTPFSKVHFVSGGAPGSGKRR